RRRPPVLDEQQQRRDQEERERVAEGAVEHGIVEQVGAERDRDQRREHHPVAEVQAQHAAEDHEPGDEIRQAGRADDVLVVEREAVAREIRPPREHVRDEEERQHQDRDAHRVDGQPSTALGPPVDADRLLDVVAGAAIESQRFERRVAVGDPGRQVFVVADAVAPDRPIAQMPGVDGAVCEQAERGGGRWNVVERATDHRRGSVAARGYTCQGGDSHDMAARGAPAPADGGSARDGCGRREGDGSERRPARGGGVGDGRRRRPDFATADRKMVLMVNFGPAALYTRAKAQKEYHGMAMPLFHADVAGVGDEAFDSPPGPFQYVLYVRKGNAAASFTAYVTGANKATLTMEQIE